MEILHQKNNKNTADKVKRAKLKIIFGTLNDLLWVVVVLFLVELVLFTVVLVEVINILMLALLKATSDNLIVL